MKKTNKNLVLLYMIFGTALITANCIASKVFTTGLTLNGAAVTLTVGAICYPLTFLVTDIIGELWGKKEANVAVTGGFICQLVSTLIIIIARYLPAVDPTVQDSYVALLGQNYMFVIASLCAYLVSQKWDVFMFHKIRDSYIAKHGSTKGGKWLWNNGSTMTSQLWDSVIYVIIAFGIGFGWIHDQAMWATMGNMILAQWILKVVFAALDTPFFYLLTRNSDKEGQA